MSEYEETFGEYAERVVALSRETANSQLSAVYVQNLVICLCEDLTTTRKELAELKQAFGEIDISKETIESETVKP